MNRDNPAKISERPDNPGVFSSATSPVHLGAMLSYASPVAASYLLFMPIGIVLQGIYATHFGMALTSIAAVFFISRIFDAVSDPIIGYVSDRAREAGIGRKSWIIVGGLALIFCAWFLYVPPENVSTRYFLAWSIAFYLAWTIFDVSHYAWGSELTREPLTRIRIFSLRGGMVYVGAIGFYALPLLPIFESSEFTPLTLQYAVGIAAILMLISLVGAARFAPAGQFVRPTEKETLKSVLNLIVSNKPFLLYAVIFGFTGAAGGIWLSQTFIVFDKYYGIGESIALMYTMGSVAGIIGLPMWLKLATKIGKKKCWAVAQLINVCCFIVPMFVRPGENALVPLFIATMGIFFSEGCRLSVLPSLLADIVDYGTWKNGSDRAGTYFAFNTLLQKTSIGVGAGVGLWLLATLGFDPATVTVGDESAAEAVRISFGIAPSIVIGLSLLFLLPMKMSAKHSSIIRKRLHRRTARS